jgi:hypothetical protein
MEPGTGKPAATGVMSLPGFFSQPYLHAATVQAARVRPNSSLSSACWPTLWQTLLIGGGPARAPANSCRGKPGNHEHLHEDTKAPRVPVHVTGHDNLHVKQVQWPNIQGIHVDPTRFLLLVVH